MKYIVRHKLRKEMGLTFLIEATTEEEILQGYNLKITVIAKEQDLFFSKLCAEPTPGVSLYFWKEDYLQENWYIKRANGILSPLRLVHSQKSAERQINSLIHHWKDYHDDAIAKNQKLQRKWRQKEN